jgi:hypothetical protein
MKGQEVLSVILISGILIGVVGSVYFWGVPLIQKNKDISTLEGSEDFMRNLNTKIKNVANAGGRDQLVINVPGLVKFDGSVVELITDTEGIIYAANAEIPLGRNACTSTTGVFGVDEPETLCVKSTKISEQAFRTDYTLKYITLQSTDVQRDYQITLTGGLKSGSTDNRIIIENKGSSSTVQNGRTLVQTLIEINIV